MTHRGPLQPLLFCDSVILHMQGDKPGDTVRENFSVSWAALSPVKFKGTLSGSKQDTWMSHAVPSSGLLAFLQPVFF